MNNTGFIVILAYPDTVVRVAKREVLSKVWPYFGVGGKNRVQAGHAALLLIEKESGLVEYYDFGRYITADTFGRVRGMNTDYEVEIPMKARHNNVEIENLKEILLFLEKSPDKTHGEGRMVVSVNHHINYAIARKYISELQAQNHVPYGAFIKEASNCARFVTDTLIHSATDKSVVNKLKRSKYLTPSPISNIIKGGLLDSSFFQVFNQEIKDYKNRSISKEHRKCFFNNVSQEVNEIGTVLPNRDIYDSKTGQWLGGVGSGAWFEIEKNDSNRRYRIVRKNFRGVIDIDAVFEILQKGFEIEEPFEFLHGSNGSECLIRQGNEVYKFLFCEKN